MSELDEQMIELTIEALTGTVYDLCVSPFETILGIKMKIQRLEGIPVYQQQLVHDNIELHDEFCLEEYSIGSGAQLKLLLAMRGGPIHAHRVQLEDPTLLEIAEVLESRDLDHKYTVMLLREGDMVDMTDFVQVVADESPGHVSPLPQAATAEQETTSLALSKVTRNKMQDLMFRLRNRRQLSQASDVNDDHSGSELHRTTAKVLILNSRSSSRLFRSSAPSPLTPHPKGTPTNTQTSSAVHRKLVFPAEDGETTISDGCTGSEDATLLRHKEARLDEDGVSSSSTHPDQQQQEYSHKHSHRQPSNAGLHHQERLHPHKQSTERHHRHWRRHQRLRRPSCLQEKTTPTTQHKHHDVNELSKELSQLGLRQKERSKVAADILPPLPSSKPTAQTHHRQCSGVPRLPAISVNHAPCLTGRQGSNGRPHCAQCGKKTGLASTYTCRCQGVFCSLHRYSETHSCPFDYKAQGRETIARSNPLVVAPKLPKI